MRIRKNWGRFPSPAGRKSGAGSGKQGAACCRVYAFGAHPVPGTFYGRTRLCSAEGCIWLPESAGSGVPKDDVPHDVWRACAHCGLSSSPGSVDPVNWIRFWGMQTFASTEVIGQVRPAHINEGQNPFRRAFSGNEFGTISRSNHQKKEITQKSQGSIPYLVRIRRPQIFLQEAHRNTHDRCVLLFLHDGICSCM